MVQITQGPIPMHNDRLSGEPRFGFHSEIDVSQKPVNRLFFLAIADEKAHQLDHAGQKQPEDPAVDKPTHLSQLITEVNLGQKVTLPERYPQADQHQHNQLRQNRPDITRLVLFNSQIRCSRKGLSLPHPKFVSGGFCVDYPTIPFNLVFCQQARPELILT